ncbi:formylmethanofuran dehydrogenase subunit A [Candidatus Formimonas warabiya]|uniref:Formylmethanofuran dehydrogenase subunit A n=1 Tax=Formimonas warabiya TaxID=1761012 RepID=A0A3G1KPI4_FORW1|nr:formylmethanofuran dehydrogenase subunit A [Candidatus Formimonas warabiya]ATW24045.1 formylmethanofuran dehydrogenase subunit A [Candidatus Formimonas warabiya]
MLKIVNGQVYDPIHGVRGEVKDIFMEKGRIMEPPLSGAVDEIIDAAGCVVMPGGIEIHSHIAGAKVNSARSMCPEDHYDHFKLSTKETRSGTGYTVPSTFLTGYLYAQLGYTTAFEAAVPALEARHAHEELTDTPLLDAGIYTLMGNNHMIMKVLSDPDPCACKERLRDLVTWLLTSSKGYAVKVVNPGGVESWKWSQGAVDLDTAIPPFGVTPRKMLLNLAEVVRDLKLPHALHLHANHLGEAGNYRTTLETMRALEGYRVHFTHLQFHSYGLTKKGGIRSAARRIAEYLNEHPEFTCDVGQIVFGPATTMTADSPMQFRLHQMTGHKWINADIEMETGSGIVPMMYRPSVLINAIQWCIGLELLLLVKNPWQIILTTDHPNAGPFTSYPHIIRLLMDADYRNAMFQTLHPKVAQYTHLKELDREYSLEEIAIVTRSAAAKALGLPQKGHLGAGAEADVAIYRVQQDQEKMFAQPAYVLKEGKVVVRNGEAVQSFPGRRLLVEPDGAKALGSDLALDFANYYSIALSNFPVQEEYLCRPEVIPCI